jgi:hypothetical protein
MEAKDNLNTELDSSEVYQFFLIFNGTTTLSITALSIATFSTNVLFVTFSITALSIATFGTNVLFVTFSITTLSITTFNKNGLFATFSIMTLSILTLSITTLTLC